MYPSLFLTDLSVEFWSITEFNNINLFTSVSQFCNIESSTVLVDLLVVSPSFNSVVYPLVSNGGFALCYLIIFTSKSHLVFIITACWYPFPLGNSTFIVSYSSKWFSVGELSCSGMACYGSLGLVVEAAPYPKGKFPQNMIQYRPVWPGYHTL